MTDQHWTDRLRDAGDHLRGAGERLFGADEEALDLGERTADVGFLPEQPHRPDGFAAVAPPWSHKPAAPSAECPVPHHDQQQLERWLRWCTREFGPPAEQSAVRPAATFYPVGYRGSTEQVEELVRRVSTVMRVQAPDLEVRHFEAVPAERGSTTVGTYHAEDGRPVISLDLRSREDPAVLTAIIAHELAHVRLRAEGRLPAWERDEEKLTDFLTVHLGMGVFSANGAHHFARTTHGWSVLPMGDLTDQMLAGRRFGPVHHYGYLTHQQFGYTLACWTHLRADPTPTWAKHLTPTIRAHLHRGLAYLQHTRHRLDD
ncbi:hypothetical protein C7C46_01455 [Streptomyces tateyamensis]|uniref:Uncharacterized protein n=1 Tax=Streptomyces tateyamensis TaxID=565073 RepID=A0A2V4PAY9_9ACTN|nr:hypothetical protein [Streptomyces tateyamensis]PYC88139.1 hypothetical protein C7C46_01455 [Streptomyces tateyamensis]